MSQSISPGDQKKTNRDIETLALMIAIHCRGRHKNEPKRTLALQVSEDPPVNKSYKVCEECRKLALYASERVANCPVKDAQAFCSSCTVHCYKAEMREKIRETMRYSGPRMIIYQPRMALRHVLSRRRAKKS